MSGRDYQTKQQPFEGGFQKNSYPNNPIKSQRAAYSANRYNDNSSRNYNDGFSHSSSNSGYERHGYHHQEQYGRHFSSKFNEMEFSKELVRILRHGKYQQIHMDKEGFVKVNDILNDSNFKRKFGMVKMETVQDIVESNDKKRFELKREGSEFFIKANQGHTVKVQNLQLTMITDPKQYPNVYHGTYFDAWEKIKKTGLNRMNRNHIHFAIGLPDDRDVISGMRLSSEVAIEINMEKAMKDGIKFFLSSNKVILSEGDHEGAIHPEYFQRVMQIRPMQLLKFDIPPDFNKRKNPDSISKKSLKSQNPSEKASKAQTTKDANFASEKGKTDTNEVPKDMFLDESNQTAGQGPLVSTSTTSQSDDVLKETKSQKKRKRKKTKSEESGEKKEISSIEFVLPQTSESLGSKEKQKNNKPNEKDTSADKTSEKQEKSLKKNKQQKKKAGSKMNRGVKSDTVVGEPTFCLPAAYESGKAEQESVDKNKGKQKHSNKRNNQKH